MTRTAQDQAAPNQATPSRAAQNHALQTPAKDRGRVAKGLLNTIPIVLVGSMAMSLNLTGPVAEAEAQQPPRDKSTPSELGKNIREALAAAHAASTAEATSTGIVTTTGAPPATYKVVSGDTVSGIAGRFGIATASVLALNGLGWKSVIFPGQVLKLSNASAVPSAPAPAPSPAPVANTGRYTIVAGDTIGKIAAKFKIPTQAVLNANGLSWSSVIYAGRALTIPGQATPAAVQQAPVAAPVVVPVVSVAPVAPPAANTAHVIKAGETVAGIAKSYGVSIQAILNANGLGWSSIIYGGRTLVIPGVPVAPATLGGVTPLTPEMAQNARTIIGVGKSLGVGDYGLVIALATAMQESSLYNLNYGDRDSLGLFQQRPSTGWGTPAQVTDPVYSARLFFGGPTNPNRGVTRGLLEIPGWQSKTVTQAAQAVQISAFPDAYAKWEVSAWAWLDQLT